MFELALNCGGLSIFLVNLETSQLLNNKYFWEQKLQFNKLTNLVEELNYKSYTKISESYRLANLIIDKNIRTNFTINVENFNERIIVFRWCREYKIYNHTYKVECNKSKSEIEFLLAINIYKYGSDSITTNSRIDKYLDDLEVD